MQPRHAALDPYRAREQRRVLPDKRTRLGGGVAPERRDREVSGLTEQMRRNIRNLFLLDKLTEVAPHTALMRVAPVAIHREPDDVPTDDQKGLQITGVQELPSLFSPLREDVVADELFNIEELPDLSDYFVSRHSLNQKGAATPPQVKMKQLLSLTEQAFVYQPYPYTLDREVEN